MPQLENNKKTILFSYTLHSGNWHNSFIFLNSLVYLSTAFNNVDSFGIPVEPSGLLGKDKILLKATLMGITVQSLFNGPFIWISAVSLAAPLSWI